jgi:DNA-binding transcriptional LysR family regulator
VADGRTPVARADNLKRLSAQFVAQDKGRLTIAATHNQASYVLPPVLRASRRNFPMWRSKSVRAPRYVSDMLLRGEADIGLATQALDEVSDLSTFLFRLGPCGDCARWPSSDAFVGAHFGRYRGFSADYLQP